MAGPTTALERNHTTGLSDSTHSSSSSTASKYSLDEADERPILLYKYRGGRLKTSSQKEVCAWLDKDDSLRVTKKSIPRGTSYVDVKRNDLYLDEEKVQYAKFPNYDASLASIKIPSMAYWSRLLLGNYSDLYIISPESSTSSSLADDESRRVSPTSTWAQDLDARLGALADS